jgi:hypothetical protein
MCIIAGHAKTRKQRGDTAKFQPHVATLVGVPGFRRRRNVLPGKIPQIKARPSLESAFLLCGGGHSTEFPLLLGSASIVSNSVIDLQDKTYCIIVHIHFVGAPAVVALSLEKGRTSLRFAK